MFLLGQLVLIATDNAQAHSGLSTMSRRSCSTKGFILFLLIEFHRVDTFLASWWVHHKISYITYTPYAHTHTHRICTLHSFMLKLEFHKTVGKDLIFYDSFHFLMIIFRVFIQLQWLASLNISFREKKERWHLKSTTIIS